VYASVQSEPHDKPCHIRVANRIPHPAISNREGIRSILRSLALTEAGMLYHERYGYVVLPPCPQLERIHFVSTNETGRIGAILEPFVLAYGSTLESIYATFDDDVTNVQALSPYSMGALAWCTKAS
jgi:hypothetical protein